MDAARARNVSEPSVGVVPVVGPALQALSDGKTRLPLKKGGLGHTSAAMLSSGLTRAIPPASCSCAAG